MGSEREGAEGAPLRHQPPESAQQVLARLSRILGAATPDGLDVAVEDCLATFGQAMGVDLAFTILVDSADRVADSWSWARPGLEVRRVVVGSDVRTSFGSSIEFLALGQSVPVTDLAELELGPAERALADANGTRALLLAPVQVGTTLLGFTGLQSIGARAWTGGEVAQTELVAQLLEQAVGRTRERGALAAADARARRIAEYIPDGLLLLDLAGRIRWASPSFLRDTGLESDDVVDHVASDFVHPDDRSTVVKAFATDRGRGTGVEFRLPAGSGWRWASASWQLVHDDDPAVPDEVVVSLRDTHDERLHTQRLEAATAHDALTGALNRHGFARSVGSLVEDGADVVLAYVDIDRFKVVNDDLGHEAGDEVLRRVALGLRSAVRVGDLVARLGGDEFCVVAGATGIEQGVEGFAARLSNAMREVLTAEPPTASVSIGVAGPAPAGDIELLRSQADAAMYGVKRAGGDHWAVG